jgi:exodeoxyribonuclease-3
LSGTHTERFPISPGELADMTCGVNGEDFIQQFRPTYFTADWKDGFLVQVRIWGPRVLDDGSLGKRHLDHRWKQTPTRGPVR